MIRIPKVKKVYDKTVGDFPPCVVCGRPIKDPNHKSVRVVEGGSHLVTENELKLLYQHDRATIEPGDMYFFPIGPNCLRNHPELKPYAEPFKDLVPNDEVVPNA